LRWDCVVGFPLLTTIALQHITSARSIVFIGLLPLATAAFGVLRGGEQASIPTRHGFNPAKKASTFEKSRCRVGREERQKSASVADTRLPLRLKRRMAAK
jgi:hypothetical protein